MSFIQDIVKDFNNDHIKPDRSGLTILRNNKFQIALPKGWIDQTVYRYEGPEMDGVKHHINVSIDSDVKGLSLVEYAQVQIQMVASSLNGYCVLKQGTIRLYNQVPAYENVYRWTPIEGQYIYQRSLYIFNDNLAYTLLASFTKHSWKTQGATIDMMMKSFSLG